MTMAAALPQKIALLRCSAFRVGDEMAITTACRPKAQYWPAQWRQKRFRRDEESSRPNSMATPLL